MGVHATGIGRGNAWPCVADPDGEMFACAAVGTVSLLCGVPVGSIADPGPGDCEDDLVLVHMTACQPHALRVRRWLAERAGPGCQVETYGTEYLMSVWGQMREHTADLPLVRLERTAV